ncbi:MAG: hypothetical protein KKC75_02315 [Nanoarchaeota archaeon]|nr:hypothetical protein [Nanoarchaeota archaeon]MBU1004693.1 hypothetical protein [Nanoarchaeota archaeon]MBU1945376.1 hypothetical protein [Nanoarchaeota archaeon]
MISEFKKINELFKEIDASLKTKVNFYVIGGAVLLYHKLKEATKDVDIIVNSEEEFYAAEKAFRDLRFFTRIPTAEYVNVNLSQIFLRKDFRIDLFNRVVCKGFSLSDGMIKRSEKVFELNNLEAYLCSKEDILLFKTFTEREGDVQDCIKLAETGIKWDIILKELKSQIKISGNNVWITMVGERLHVLEERGLNIPIMPQIIELVEEYFDDFEKRMAEGSK